MLNFYSINDNAVLEAIEKVHGKQAYVAGISGEHFGRHPYDTEPLQGYVQPPNFPNCCDSHKETFKTAVDFLAVFPNCCKEHKKLNSAPWFRKTYFSYYPLKLVTTINYTWHCITENIHKENWYKAITDYIDWTQDSYGQLPAGYGAPIGKGTYLETIKGNIKANKKFSKQKKALLIEFIESYFNKGEGVTPANQTDLNILIATYKKWLTIFPLK